ncbi:hypothetical protein [Undibacterium fentianense]|uniref:Uncharacterized protein n=1 Tax=Undibacterium fentianense TaxID=2828728 RepID=A0A941EAH3_9BURK|nr:hypothetical protein [Undibacterium fentianense]MBR7801533.1 hypothetical protein [Undibacterium fentianense]
MKFLLTLSSILLSFNALASDLLKPNQMFCPVANQKDIVAIADAKTDEEVKRAIGGAIFSGACSAPMAEYIEISKIEKKRTKLGHTYFCFEMPFSEDSAKFCALQDSVTTVKYEQSQRVGDYDIVVEGPMGLKATCREGGKVLVLKGSQWKRVSMLFVAEKPPTEVNITQDLNVELRAGCKGVDYM